MSENSFYYTVVLRPRSLSRSSPAQPPKRNVRSIRFQLLRPKLKTCTDFRVQVKVASEPVQILSGAQQLLKSLIDALIPSLILELRFKTLRRPLSLFVGFPTASLASLTPETSLGTKWWACSGNPTPSKACIEPTAR